MFRPILTFTTKPIICMPLPLDILRTGPIRPASPLPDFLRIGLSRGRQTGGRQELSEFIRQSNDIVFYRHWHGPLYHYFLIPVSRLGLNEHGVRTAMLAIPVVDASGDLFRMLVAHSRNPRSFNRRPGRRPVSFELYGFPLHRTRASSALRSVLPRLPDLSREDHGQRPPLGLVRGGDHGGIGFLHLGSRLRRRSHAGHLRLHRTRSPAHELAAWPPDRWHCSPLRC